MSAAARWSAVGASGWMAGLCLHACASRQEMAAVVADGGVDVGTPDGSTEAPDVDSADTDPGDSEAGTSDAAAVPPSWSFFSYDPGAPFLTGAALALAMSAYQLGSVAPGR